MRKLWRQTWCYKTYDFLTSWYQYKKSKRAISQVFYSDEFKLVLRKYLNTPFRKDWLGRLYGVINPMINNSGELDISSTIIEVDGDNTNSNVYVDNWLFKQLDLIKSLFKLNNLYDYINVSTTHVGPINQDNYLVIFDIVDRKEFAIAAKRWIWTTLIYLGIAAAVVLPIVLK